MKNIETILKEAGITLTEEQSSGITKEVDENYKPIADWQKQHDKVQNLTEQLDTAKETLEKFDGIDADGLKKQVEDLQKELEDKDTEYQEKIADRDFQDMLKDAYRKRQRKECQGNNWLCWMLDSLKASKNQKEDVRSGIKEVDEAEDSKMLFGEPEVHMGSGDPIGRVTQGSENDDSEMRAIMGLPPKEGGN